MKDEQSGWLPRWLARELEDNGRFSWRAFLMVALLCLLAYLVLQYFGGRYPGVF